MPASIPLSITIPAIKVDSTLLKLGRTTTGALEVPPPGPTYNDAGWYKYSPTPGSLGPSVIAGHVDSAADGPSVFYRLGALHRGDSVRVARSDGTIAIFTVRDVLRFRKTAFPTQLVYGNTDYAALRLITCGGPFNSATGHYEDNVVVLASLTPPSSR
jgi:sortase (surface protein transpeptidase)